MTEDQLEQETLAWLQDVGYTCRNGYDIAPDGPAPERSSFTQALLPFRLREAIHKLNPGIPAAAREDAFKQGFYAQSLEISRLAFLGCRKTY